MKKLYTTVFAICIAIFASAQINLRSDKTIRVPNKNIHSQNTVLPSPALLTNAVFENANCLSKETQQKMWNENQKNIKMLRAKNPGGRNSSMVHPYFIWPTQPKAGFTDYGYYTITNYIDHDALYPNHVLDYNCGNRTYDWGTGNHAGTDIILWPYPWRRMAEQVMEVVAAAPGVIINKVDGNYDLNCVLSGSQAWNNIHVLHDDGSEGWYLHFKTGSLTTKNIGDSVVTGEYLGTAGSSGSSTIPHLHFQVMDSSGNVIDPWDGTCNSINPGDSWWQTQQAYYVPSVNRICTKSTEMDYYNCPNAEITYEKDTFNIGDSLWLWIYTRDLDTNSTAQINIYDPAMQNQINWSFTVPWPTNSTSYVRWYYLVDSWWTQGWWTFEVVYGGNTYQHLFYMTHSAAGINDQHFLSNVSVSPNPSDGNFQVEFTSEKVSQAEIEIVNILGEKISSSTIFLKKGQNKIPFGKQKLPAGIYSLNIVSDENFISKKIIIN